MRNSWLERRNPSVKLGVTLLASLVVLPVITPAPVAGLYLAALLAALTVGRVPTRTLILGQVPFVTFSLGIIAVNAMTRSGTVLWSLAGLNVTREGVVIGVAVALRSLFIGVLTIMLVSTTPPRALMVSLVKDMRLSPRYAYAILAGHRMLASMPQRWTTIRDAQLVRAPRTKAGKPRRKVRLFASASFTLLVSAVRSAETTALALESRGLGLAGRTLWKAPELGRLDGVMVAVVLAVLGVFLAAALW